jgi:hypothetical protein
MTSTLERTGEISIGAERTAVRAIPSGTRMRLTGALWLAWLEHIQRCQTKGLEAVTDSCPRHKGQITALEAAYPQWNCCTTHRTLKAERQRLVDYVVSSGMHRPAPHQSDDPFSPAWWRERNYKFDIRTPVVD